MNIISDEIREKLTHHFSNLKLELSGHYFLIDIGANLANRKYARDLDKVIERARHVGKHRRHRLWPHLHCTQSHYLQSHLFRIRCGQNYCHRNFISDKS